MSSGEYDPFNPPVQGKVLGESDREKLIASYPGGPGLEISERRDYYRDNVTNNASITNGYRFSSFSTHYKDPDGSWVDITDVETGADGSGQPTLVELLDGVKWPLPNLNSSPSTTSGSPGGTYHFQPGIPLLQEPLATWLSVPDKMYGSGESLLNTNDESRKMSEQDFEHLDLGSSS